MNTRIATRHKKEQPISSGPWKLILTFCLAVTLVAFGLAISSFFQPHVTFARELPSKMAGMNILGWEKSKTGKLSVVVASDRGWEHAPGAPKIREDRVLLAKFSYEIDDQSPGSAQDIGLQLDKDLNALTVGQRPSSFSGFYTTGRMATIASGMSGSNMGQAAKGILGIAGLALVMMLGSLVALIKSNDSELRVFVVGAAVLTTAMCLLLVNMLGETTLFEALTYITSLG